METFLEDCGGRRAHAANAWRYRPNGTVTTPAVIAAAPGGWRLGLPLS
ncbi:hypothetical protein [Rhodococcus coprophilus]